MGVDGHPSSAPPSERQQWQRLFGALVEMLRRRQHQVETLAADRNLLQEYVHLQHDRWASKARLLESQISQARKEEEMRWRVEEAKLGLMISLRQVESSCYKEMAEVADNDLQDFHECVETLNCENLALKEKLEEGKSEETDTGVRGPSDLVATKNRKEEENVSSGLLELKKWKQAYKKLSSKKEAEVSALLAEKDFVWHQFKKMETDYTGVVKSNQVEGEQANEALEKLQTTVEKLQSSAADKDEMIDKLKAELSRAKLELRSLRSHTGEAQTTDEEIKKLHLEMEKLLLSVKEKDGIIAKLQSELAKHEVNMRRCSNKKSSTPNVSSLRTKAGHQRTPARRHQGMPLSQSSCMPNDSSGSRTADMVLRQSSKRRSVEPISMLDSPKLFPSSFKVPKLKIPSPAPV